MGNSADKKAVPESFAISARSAVNKIEPQRTLRARRIMENKAGMKAIPESFAFSVCLAVN